MSFVKNLFKKGDTLIEITFAIGVFSLISILSLQIMDKDLAAIQGALELEMARNEIDAQAEAIRFVHNAYMSEHDLAPSARAYQGLWYRISRDQSVSIDAAGNTGVVKLPTDISQYSASVPCSTYYDKTNSSQTIHNLYADVGFVFNTRKLDPTNIAETIIRSDDALGGQKKFAEAGVYPRLIFSNGADLDNGDGSAISESAASGSTGLNRQDAPVFDQVDRVEGIWVIASRDITKGVDKTPEFFDYHIRTCWYAPGHDTPSILSTTIRLYNPDMLND